jgi:zinc/manganese transport system substrate-binding protein
VLRSGLAFAVVLAAVAATLALLGCGQGGPAPAGAGRLNVVAAEGFWGSIARQLGGDRVAVTDIVASPAADPHDYEPTAEDARALAGSQMAIVTGIGYDRWATKLLEASPSSARTVLDAGDLLGLESGDNPHQWYSPSSVQRVIDRIAADYSRADPRHAAYFAARRKRFETLGLARYRRLIAAIRERYAGTPIGASESIVEPLARALGLRLLTPRGFMDAIAEGTEPTPSDKAAADRQIARRQIAVWIYNSQNATPDVRRLDDAAGAAGIPIVTVTETPTPENASFQSWMTRQLETLRAALAKAAR